MAVTITPVAYGGWDRNLRIFNGDVELVVTLDVGPRIIRYGRPGGPNLLGEMAEDMGRSGETTWRLRGGHRLWVSPEDPERTYVLDNGPVSHRLEGERVVLESAGDARFSLGKRLEITLAPQGSQVHLRHRIANGGPATQDFAIWALTVMAKGGTAIIPLPGKGRHPGADARSAEDFAPGLHLALWPYFSFEDPRLRLGSKFIRLRQDSTMSATKLGLAHRPGWAAYWNAGALFLKRFPYERGANYPDGGCNFESYTDSAMLELESLSPLCEVRAGAELTHDETWYMADGVPSLSAEAADDQQVATVIAREFAGLGLGDTRAV